MPRETTDVLIVGGGPSGLLSALLLARWNVRSIVLERNAVTDEHPKAHELNARSIEILREAGIEEHELAAEASPLEDASRILFCRSINEEIGRIDLLADPARRQKYQAHLRQALPYLNLSQSEFEKILVKYAQRTPLVDVRFGHAWESQSATNGTVISAIRGDSEYTIESQYLLGCDGASSRVRRSVGIEMDGPAEIQSFVNAYFEANLRDRVKTPAKLFWIIDPQYAGTLIAHHMEKRWIYAAPVHKPWERPEDFTAEVMRERIQGALGFEVPGLKITSLSTWRMTAQIAQTYRRGRVLLVGDAAHRFPPTGGLGMNTGIADAHNLCWKLGLVFAGEADDALLDSYECERKPVAKKNCEESLANFENIWDVVRALGLDPRGITYFARFANSASIRRLPAAWRRAIIQLATKPAHWLVGRGLRPGRVQLRAQRAIDAQISHFDRLGLDIGYVYERGALVSTDPEQMISENVVADYVPTTAPGARLPHRWIGSGNEQRSTLDYISYSEFSAFARGVRLRELQKDLPDGLRLLDTTGFPEELFPEDQVLLVRPDGHIAWRSRNETYHADQIRRIILSLLKSEAIVDSSRVGEPV